VKDQAVKTAGEVKEKAVGKADEPAKK